MTGAAIRVRGLSKRYRLGGARQPYRTLRDAIAENLPGRGGRDAARSRPRGDGAHRWFWALKDVSFDVAPGDVAGIIGRNGAGKSTLLKILSRITEPTEGRAEIAGRVGSLLEVGTGFHPELTGRENVFLNGAILGMRKVEILRKFDDIVSFSEVEAFIDTPVKHYSSGMYMRLAFAVAAHLDPEILLVDEVLAVGDAAFRRKCLGKMGEVAGEGRTVLLVSHDMAAVEGICRKAFLLEKGSIAKTGDSRDVVAAYLASLPASGGIPIDQRADREGNGRFRFTGIVYRSGGSPVDVVRCGDDVEFVMEYRGRNELLRNVSVSLGVYTQGGQCMLVLNNQMTGTEFESLPADGWISCLVPRFGLAPGEYAINLYCEVNGVLADWIRHAVHLTVEGGDYYGTGRLPPRGHGGFLIPHAWSAGVAPGYGAPL